ncbi:MAG: type IV secretion system DNA-binding domain-containing protein, partial [Alphaproteobacteria bacterium]|nr:type IV secretion system DNA-binding domain-containing protein [Alphaproteobacteria bacterium]
MPLILPKHQTVQRNILRDVRPVSVRMAAYMSSGNVIMAMAFGALAFLFLGPMQLRAVSELIAVPLYFYFNWALRRPFALPFKIPRFAKIMDPHNHPPGKPGVKGKADGILYLGNVSDKDDDEFGREIWLTNVDVRTHILYIGTTGSGKTEGLKSLVTNALAWGSGFSYTDGKADTDLWASLYSVTRRFGRDDDILVLNYMTGNSDDGSTSNSMNPFSNGSASYLANLVVNLMPDAGGDNAMWKERAVALMFALMPALTYKRDKQGMLLDVGVVRDHLELQPIIRLSRDQTLPARIVHGLEGYLNTLPGFVAAAFDDDGNERPPSPDQPMYDLQVARQQHGYLSMQFTRSMQSLADEYGYIFKAQLADIDVLDVVLNRRILVVLIPALEKSGDEAANLGKIVASCLKGMMGAT